MARWCKASPAGGNGGDASFVFGGSGGSGGSGQSGGDAGPVSITAPKASVILSGPNSAALVAHSIGGGDGSGGGATAVTVGHSIVISGNGGQGGRAS